MTTRPTEACASFFRYSRTSRSSLSICGKALLFAYQREVQLRVTEDGNRSDESSVPFVSP